MKRVLHSLAVLAIVVASQGASAQARQEGAARGMRDTLPERVVQRALDAFKRRDLDATFATYDTVFVHEYLGDPAGPQRVRRDEWLMKMKNDTGIVHTMNTWKVVDVRRDVFGPYVNDVWAFRTPEGKLVKHFELLEVRNGKIVREIEG